MKTKKSWVEQFDKEFIQDRKGISVYALSNEVKSFIQQLLDTQRKELLAKLPKERVKSKLTTHEQTWYLIDGYNQCLSEVRDILEVKR